MTQLAFRRKGRGRTLVLVHGYLGGSAMWTAQIDRLSAHFDVIAPDLAGFADSNRIEAPDSIDGHGRMIMDFLDSLGVKEFDLIGHSMGGMIAQQMAFDFPDKVTSLVLFGTGPVGVLPGRFETVEQSRQRIRTEGLEATARRIAATWFLNGKQAEAFPLCLELGKQASLQAAFASLKAWENWDGRENLKSISARTLVLWGDHDRSYQWSQPEALWKGIPGASLSVVANAAHNVHLEKPALFNMIVEDFLGVGSPENGMS